MRIRIYIILIMALTLFYSCEKKEDVTDKIVGVWETEWEDILEGDLDDMTVEEVIAFHEDRTFYQVFSGSVKFDDWENETDVDYLVAIEGRWKVEDLDNVVLSYDMNQLNVEIGKSAIEGDYTDAAVGLLTGDWSSLISGVLKGSNTNRLNKQVEAEMKKQITRYFKDMFREMNKDKEAFTDVKISNGTLSAEVNHGFFGRSAVYNSKTPPNNSHISSGSDSSSNSHSKSESDYIVELTGKIGKYPIKMYLNLKNIDNDDKCEIDGKYCYTSSGSGDYLKLSGVKQGKNLELREYNDKGERTGTFDGTFSIFGNLSSFEYSGTFTNYQGKLFNFNLSSN